MGFLAVNVVLDTYHQWSIGRLGYLGMVRGLRPWEVMLNWLATLTCGSVLYVIAARSTDEAVRKRCIVSSCYCMVEDLFI